MVRYVLDTDQISLFLTGHPRVCERVGQNFFEIAVTIVSVQELFNGWMGRLNRLEGEAEKIQVYKQLASLTEFFRLVKILNYDGAASGVYGRLILESPELGKRRLDKDVRIAAIALSQGAVMVTRNSRDFGLVPGLVVENWTD
jgi:tRNA(fMet)-specific endonuclease VapC